MFRTAGDSRAGRDAFRPLSPRSGGGRRSARSLAELGQPPLMEEIDGGVGDDSGTTILADARATRRFGLQFSSRGRISRALSRCVVRSYHRPCLAAALATERVGCHGPSVDRAGSALAWIGRFLF